ncbi:MAG: hypothetical protein JST16_04000 [Bdellovibrionales bacterium]|nr:hypothetical protein [Bdellovibrionales bacterium]
MAQSLLRIFLLSLACSATTARAQSGAQAAYERAQRRLRNSQSSPAPHRANPLPIESDPEDTPAPVGAETPTHDNASPPPEITRPLRRPAPDSDSTAPVASLNASGGFRESSRKPAWWSNAREKFVQQANGTVNGLSAIHMIGAGANSTIVDTRLRAATFGEAKRICAGMSPQGTWRLADMSTLNSIGPMLQENLPNGTAEFLWISPYRMVARLGGFDSAAEPYVQQVKFYGGGAEDTYTDLNLAAQDFAQVAAQFSPKDPEGKTYTGPRGRVLTRTQAAVVARDNNLYIRDPHTGKVGAHVLCVSGSDTPIKKYR